VFVAVFRWGMSVFECYEGSEAIVGDCGALPAIQNAAKLLCVVLAAIGV
jgi:hypothetical protein